MMISHARLDRVAAEFQRNFDKRGELGASVSIWADGAEVLSLHAGWQEKDRKIPWTAATKVLVWSATKGPSCACVLHAMENGGIALSSKVAEVWPEFAAGGKESVTLAELLSHRAGLAGLSGHVTGFDHAAVVTALALQPPLWPLGEGHGYSPRAFGFLLDELVRRITGIKLSAYWQREFAEPLNLKFFIGVPPEELSGIASVYAAPAGQPEAADAAFRSAMADPNSIPARAFSTPTGIQGVSVMNSDAYRTAAFPGFGGIGTGRALGEFYALLASGGTWEGRRYLQSETVAAMQRPLASGYDRTLCKETAFSTGFMLDPLNSSGAKVRRLFGPSPRSFGHPGAGGCTAFADPENNMAFAYVMNQMEAGVLPGGKAGAMIEALYG